MRRLRAPWRNRTQAAEREFWRHRPIESDDPDTLRGFGSMATARHDGRAMMATGWALGTTTGLQDDAFVLLRTGFEKWRDAPGYTPSLGRRFLEQVLGEVMDPTGPIEVQHLARCWVASELIELGVEPVMERLLYGVISDSVQAFAPARSVRWACDYAARHDLPAPWP